MKTNITSGLERWRLLILLLGVNLSVSCSDKKATNNKKPEIETTNTHRTQPTSFDQNEKVLLCTINGEDWYYTEVHCRKILSTDYTPREKFVLNFKNKATKAGESITLMYNANTKELEHVDVALQDPNDDPGRRIFFGIKAFTDKEREQIKEIGILTDISNGTISGTASFTIPKNSKGVFKNVFDEDIVVTDFKFTNIQFKDESEY